MKDGLPGLICPGAEKAGTSSLYSILVQHSQIFDSGVKEPMFFNRYYEHGISYYKRIYAKNNGERYIPDFTVLYMTKEIYVQRMLDVLGPDIKIILMLRNPVDRFFSQFYMKRMNASESNGDASEVFQRDYEVFTQEPDKSIYYSHGLYGMQLDWFLARFFEDNIHIVLFEDFINNTAAVVSRILVFLGLNEEPDMNMSIWKNRTKVSNPSQNALILRKLIDKIPDSLKTALPTQFRIKFLKTANRVIYSHGGESVDYRDPLLCRRILDTYREDIAKLSEMTGLDLSSWTDLEQYDNSEDGSGHQR